MSPKIDFRQPLRQVLFNPLNILQISHNLPNFLGTYLGNLLSKPQVLHDISKFFDSLGRPYIIPLSIPYRRQAPRQMINMQTHAKHMKQKETEIILSLKETKVSFSFIFLDILTILKFHSKPKVLLIFFFANNFIECDKQQ